MERVDFFVSYTSADRRWAEWLAWVLEEAGYTVRIQAWDFGAGANFVLEMDEAARIGQRTLAVLSPGFLESRFAAAEWAAAFVEDPQAQRRALWPVRVRECDPRGLLGAIVYTDLVGLGEQAARERLLAAAGGARAKPTDAPGFPGQAQASGDGQGGRPALPQGGAAIWNVPAIAGRFVGRETLLDDLAHRFAAGETAALTQAQALHGLGGVGKTRAAVEFARRHRAEYDVVWWVRCEDAVTILADYTMLADALGLPDPGEREQEARVAPVRAWCETHGRWLLVFDNAPGPEALRELMPDAGGGDVLITSRRQGGWRGIADPQPVDVWLRTESVSFLVGRTGDRDAAAAESIAETLGDLPLALEQAGAYVDNMQISLAGYRRRLASHAPTLFERGRPPDYEHSVATTWELAFAELEEDSGCAAVLFCCAFLAPEQIPRGLFASDAIANGVFTGANGDLALDDAVKRTLAFSLVTADESYLTMHRLVQRVIRNRLGDQQPYWLAISERLVGETFPAAGDDHREWPACERLLPHALAVTDWEMQAGAESPQTATLLFSVALYLNGRAAFAAAKDLYQRALQIFEAAYEPEHPQVAITLGNLGNLLARSGDLEGAREHQRRAANLRGGVRARAPPGRHDAHEPRQRPATAGRSGR